MSGRRQLLWFTLIHPLVDACSVSVLVAGGMTWGRAMAYNAIAFALQLPLGVALDFMRPEVTARCFWLGTCAVSAAICLPAFAAALAACLVAKNRAEDGTAQNYAENGAATSEGARVVGGMVLLGLFALIAWRSWAALAATSLTMAAGVGFAATGAAATWGGKATGGYLAERLGRWQVTAASVCGSAALAFLCSPDSAAAWMALLFVSQLATGPVVSLVYDRTRRIGGGTAFGLNCLGLFAGVGG